MHCITPALGSSANWNPSISRKSAAHSHQVWTITMLAHPVSRVRVRFQRLLLLFTLMAFANPAVSAGPQIEVLRIGATGTLSGKAASAKEKAGLQTLHSFITEETGFRNEIDGQLKWQELADNMAKGRYHLGVYQNHEFAWAQERCPELKALAVGINSQRYPVACVVARRDNGAAEFDGLKGQPFAFPVGGQPYLTLFVDRQCAASGGKPDAFFKSVTTSSETEDLLDDVVDGKINAAAVDATSLEAYKRRKPGRFAKLKEIARSQPFPPVVVAFCGTFVDEPTLAKFKKGLVDAQKKAKGEMLLTLARLTAFEAVPSDFAQVIDRTRKDYPVDDAKNSDIRRNER
jgi:ABC-type phosphate/phosphonate transport system substrate-binding protein